MIKKIIFAICMLVSFGANAQNSKIQAVVNGEIITTSDLNDRLKNFLFISKAPITGQNQSLIKQQILHQAIDEKLKLVEAEKNGVKIEDKEINEAIKKFEEKNGSLKNADVALDVLKSQIKADMAWSRLIAMKTFDVKNITQKEVEDARADAIKDMNTPKRMISEIYILKDKAKNISELVDLLKKDNRFELYAQQFSDSPSAGRGGKLGWVNVGRFDDNIERVLETMKEGDVSNPILSGNGYYILRLEKNFDPEKETPFIPSVEDMKKFLQNKKVELYMQDYSQKMRQNAIVELR